jgi:hypothetical protein
MGDNTKLHLRIYRHDLALRKVSFCDQSLSFHHALGSDLHTVEDFPKGGFEFSGRFQKIRILHNVIELEQVRKVPSRRGLETIAEEAKRANNSEERKGFGWLWIEENDTAKGQDEFSHSFDGRFRCTHQPIEVKQRICHPSSISKRKDKIIMMLC